VIKRKQIAFNMDDAHQRDLHDWVMSKTTNFSGFVKSVLFAQMAGTSGVAESTEIIDDPLMVDMVM